MNDAPPASRRSPFGPAPAIRLIWPAFGAILVLTGLLVPSATWIDWFQHPIRVERSGGVPETTIAGVRLLRGCLVVAGVAWSVLLPSLAWMDRRHPTEPRPGRADVSRWSLALLLLIVVAGLIPRALRLQESLWYDEIAALISSSLHGVGPALGNYHALANHAFHSAAAAVSMQQLGQHDAELALRLPAVLAGVACIPAMFWLGRIVDGERLGLLGAFVIGLMPVAILEGAEARGYSLMMLCTILATGHWLRIRDGRWNSVGLYALVVAVGCWSHLVFACVPLGHAAQALVRPWRLPEDRSVAWRWWTSLALAGFTTLMVLSPLLPDLLERRTEFIALDGDEPSPLGAEGLHTLLQLGGSWTWWAALPGLGLFVLGLTESRRWPRLSVAVHAGLAGGIVGLALTILGGSWLYARFLVFLLIPASLLIASALAGLAHFGRRAEPAVLAGALLTTTWLTSLALLPAKQPIRDAVALLRSETATDDSAWSIGLGDDVAMFYTEGRGPRLVHAPRLGANLDRDMLAVGPDAAIMLYPDLVSEETWTRLDEAGFRTLGRFPGWLDWGRGDVVVLGRPRASSPSKVDGG